MRVYYDTEFLASATHIDLISIGMVAEDGRELYCVSSEFNVSRVVEDPWLVKNVWPSLPLREHAPLEQCACPQKHLDVQHPDVMGRAQIREEVEEFILSTPNVELWAWYGAYDHVALAGLWGTMSALPYGVPMFTCDLKQEAVRLGDPDVPLQEEGLHNALADARHNVVIGRFLSKLEAGS